MELRIVDHLEHEVFATHGPLLIRVVTGGQSSKQRFDRARELIEATLERYPAVALVVIVEHGAPTPPPEVRARMAEGFTQYGDRLVVAFALLGLGFWASAAARIVRGFARAGGQLYLHDTKLEGIAEQLARELVGLDPASIVALCEQVRRLAVEGGARARDVAS